MFLSLSFYLSLKINKIFLKMCFMKNFLKIHKKFAIEWLHSTHYPARTFISGGLRAPAQPTQWLSIHLILKQIPGIVSLRF